MSYKVEPELFSNMIDTDAEYIPVLTIEQGQLSQNESVPEELPIMPLRN